MTPKVKGYICGVAAAICYGTNPLGALPLAKLGVDVNTIVFWRYALAALLLLPVLLYRGVSLRVSRRQLAVVGSLGILFGLSSLTLYESFNYMDAGIACTILFVYPIMVAVIMGGLFHEHIGTPTMLSICLALCGIFLLNDPFGSGASLSGTGIILVLVSSLTYAIYMVAVNRAHLGMGTLLLTFYVLCFCAITAACGAFAGGYLPRVDLTAEIWGWELMLAILPTFLSILLINVSLVEIGSTPTAILGALEPLTAVVIGITIFGEAFTFSLASGIVVVLCAVILVILAKSREKTPAPSGCRKN